MLQLFDNLFGRIVKEHSSRYEIVSFCAMDAWGTSEAPTIPILIPSSVTEIRNKLRALYVECKKIINKNISSEIEPNLYASYVEYIKTRNKNILCEIEFLIQALNKSVIKQLKKLFRSNPCNKNQSRSYSIVDQREKIRSLTVLDTMFFDSVTDCEESSHIVFSKGKHILFSNIKNVVYVQQGRAYQIDSRSYKQ